MLYRRQERKMSSGDCGAGSLSNVWFTVANSRFVSLQFSLSDYKERSFFASTGLYVCLCVRALKAAQQCSKASPLRFSLVILHEHGYTPTLRTCVQKNEGLFIKSSLFLSRLNTPFYSPTLLCLSLLGLPHCHSPRLSKSISVKGRFPFCLFFSTCWRVFDFLRPTPTSSSWHISRRVPPLSLAGARDIRQTHRHTFQR